MRVTTMILTTLNYVISSFLWLLGILTFFTNFIGLFALWHLVGFGYIFYLPLTLMPFIVALSFSCYIKDAKMVILNIIFFLISVGVTLFTVLVSTTWFW
jgi:hypothetical protein